MMKTFRLSVVTLLVIVAVVTRGVSQVCNNDTTASDILFLVDNSMSIDESEYLSFEQIIISTIQKVQSNCEGSRVAIVHYGGLQGDSTSIELTFDDDQSISQVQRQFCTSPGCDAGDDLNKAMGAVLGYLGDGSLNRDPDNNLSIVVFTDANGALTDCGVFINCSVIVPYTNIDILKSNPHNADVTVVGVSSEANDAALAVYASTGGNYIGTIRSPDCITAVDGCQLPRKYINIEFSDDINTTSDSIAGFVNCSLEIADAFTIVTSADTTICTNLGGSADISAMAMGGMAPYVYEWDNLLGFGPTKTVTVGATYTVTVTDDNGCTAIGMVTVTGDSTCCDPILDLEVTGDDRFCINFGDSATISATLTFGTSPISYSWGGAFTGSGQTISVAPAIASTYIMTATDDAGCTLTESFTVTPEVCDICMAYAGLPLPPEKICPEDNGTYRINTDPNTGMVIPAGYEVVYLLTNEDLTIIDYNIGAKTFVVNQPGLFRVHTLIAEVSNPSSPDYLDLNIIRLGSSDLFVIVNCLIDHDICADFDYAGRPTVTLPEDDIDCRKVENSINLCSDGIDNDEDGLVDCADEDCQGLNVCLEGSFIACNDLFDNDGDGLIDCDDPDCWVFNICFEKDELCNDGIDNDGDGLIDCLDDSCIGSDACKENNPFTCVDGIDNDGDGLIDCQEAVCQRFIVCAEYSESACTDGLDNDFDGLIDCADRHCQEILSNICAPSESTLAFCTDGIDNDGDGLLDCEDSDCGFLQLQALEANALDFINIADATCPGNDNGAITLLGPLSTSQYQYQLNGGTSQSGVNFNSLDSGSYQLTISTLTNCSITIDFNIDGDDCTERCADGIDNDGDGLTDCLDGDCGILGFSGSIQKTNPTCPQKDDGTITINGASDDIDYEYSVLNGMSPQSSPIFENLRPGTYQIVIRTSDGCVFRQEMTLANTECVEICGNGIDDDNNGLTDCDDPICGNEVFENQVIIEHPTCPNLNNGLIEIVPDQDFNNYTYRISGVGESNNPRFENIVPGTYTIEIINENDCIKSQQVIILESDCSEVCDNGIDDDGDGLTDCEDNDCGIIGFEDAIFITENGCDIVNTGFIEISGQVDGVDYEYSLDGGVTFMPNREIDGLESGIYNLVIRTNGGCTYSREIEVPQQDCPEICNNGRDDDRDGLVDCDDDDCGITGFDGEVLVFSVTCDSINSGSIVIGGSIPDVNYDYSINGGQSTQDTNVFRGLFAGSYLIQITTGDGCIYSEQVQILPPPSCAEICNNDIDDDGDGLIDCEDGDCGVADFGGQIIVESVTCDSSNSGSITIMGQAVGVFYTYSIDNGASEQESNEFDGLIGGSYTILISTSDNCTYTEQVEIATPICIETCDNGTDDDGDGLIDCEDPDCGVRGFDGTITVNSSCHNDDTGSIIISGQIEGIIYTYSINAGVTIQESPEFSGLPSGDYLIFVSTSDGCGYQEEEFLDSVICAPIVEICNNDIDDDGDGLVDCDDPDCGIDQSLFMIEEINASCPDNDNGSIIVTTSDTALSWGMNTLNFQKTPFDSLTPQSYSVIIMDGNGCIEEFSATISGAQCSEICDNDIDDDGDGLVDCDDPDCGVTAFSGEIVVESVSCDSSNSASITIMGRAIGVNYTYSIDSGTTFQESNVFEGLIAGSYSVVIVTSDGCEYLEDILIASPICIETCDNGSDDDGDGLIDCEDPDCGVRDFEGQITTTNESCEATDNGSIIVSGQTIGISYTYSINAGVTTQDSAQFSGLSAGTYFLFISTSDGCGYQEEIEILPASGCDSLPTMAEICNNGVDDDDDGLIDCDDDDCGVGLSEFSINSTDPSCPDNENGTINITPNMTGQSYMYSIDNGETFQDSGLFSGISAMTGSGTQMYTVVLMNISGCSLQIDIELTPEDCTDPEDCSSFDIEAPFVEDATCPNNDNGTIIYDGPSVGLTFSLDNENFQELALFTNLDSGQYDLFVMDGEGCVEQIIVNVGGEVCESESGLFNSDLIDLRVMLEGPYSYGGGDMSTQLYELGYLPGQKPFTFFGEAPDPGQPYNMAPWFYTGSEGLTENPRELYTESVVDWILVSFRSTESRSSEFWRGAALLHNNGGVQLIEEPEIELIENREFYVLIEHRNHLPAMSPYKLSLTNGKLTYDFTQANSYRAVIGTGQKKLIDGTYAMAAGNGDLDTELSSHIDINVRDLNVWIDFNGNNSSYYLGDYDLNGDVNIKDRILWEANNGLFSTVPYR